MEETVYKRWAIEAEEKFTSEAEAREFVELAQKGNENAMESIIRKNMAMLHKYANDYSRCGSSHEDLVSEGMMAIIKAVSAFNLKSTVTVGTALITAVRTAMRRYAGSDRNIRIAINASENKSKIHAVIERMQAEGKELTIEAIAVESNFPIDTVKRLVKIDVGVVSMNVRADGDEGEGSEFGDTIADENLNPYEQMEKSDSENAVLRAVKTLPAIERTVIEYRYGLNGKGCKTLAEIAPIVGLSMERVRQIENNAVAKLRKISQL